MPNQATTYTKTDMNTAASATDYKSAIDSDFSVLARLGAVFAPHEGSTPDMHVYLDPGYSLSGTSLTEIGTYTTATFTSGSTSATVASADGITGTMWITGDGIPAGTTCTIAGTTLTLSQATTAAGSSVQVTLGQISAAITAPVTYPRIDRIVVSASTGAVEVITGTEAATPAAPALTAGVLPIAQVLLQTTTTQIVNSIITDERAIGGGGGVNDTEATVASATTTDIGGTNVNAVYITGTTTITSFGSSGSISNPYYRVRFGGALTLTYNATSLKTPGSVNIVTEAGDYALLQYMGSGNWVVVAYWRENGAPLNMGYAATIASATTTDLGSTGKNVITISGTTTITGLGSSADTSNPIYFITFSGALTLTYNATSLKLPGLANIVTAANDSCIAQYLGSGNWQILLYQKAAGSSGTSLVYNAQSGAYNPSASDLSTFMDFTGSTSAIWQLQTSALTDGWFGYIQNSGTSNASINLQSTSGTIDGVAAATGIYLYPNERRLIMFDGTNYKTIVERVFSMELNLADSPFTFNTPAGYTSLDLAGWGGGGSGSCGATIGYGAGGGGGSYNEATLATSGLSSSVTVTIGSGGAAVTLSANSETQGNPGTDTSFGTYFYAYHGGAGYSTGTNGQGGGGGGQLGAGTDGSAGGAGGSGLILNSLDWGHGGAGGADNAAGGSSYFGGGGGTAASATYTGGGSQYGGGGGGGGYGAAVGTSGGSSTYGGNGGTGGGTGYPATDGAVPGGGGGGAGWNSGTSYGGAGAAGRLTIKGVL